MSMNELPNEPIAPIVNEPIYQRWITALTRPDERTYAAMAASPNAKATTGYLWYFIGALVQVLLVALVQGVIFQKYAPELANLFGGRSSLGLIFCGGPITAVLSTLTFVIGTAVVQWIARMFGGRGTNDQLAYVLSNILTPYLVISGVLTLLYAIPVVGPLLSLVGLAAGIYIVVLEVMAVKGVNQFGWGAAIGSLLIPGLVIFLIICCAMIGIFALLYPSMREIIPQIQQSVPQY
jgi:hypothetical protein